MDVNTAACVLRSFPLRLAQRRLIVFTVAEP